MIRVDSVVTLPYVTAGDVNLVNQEDAVVNTTYPDTALITSTYLNAARITPTYLNAARIIPTYPNAARITPTHQKATRMTLSYIMDPLVIHRLRKHARVITLHPTPHHTS